MIAFTVNCTRVLFVVLWTAALTRDRFVICLILLLTTAFVMKDFLFGQSGSRLLKGGIRELKSGPTSLHVIPSSRKEYAFVALCSFITILAIVVTGALMEAKLWLLLSAVAVVMSMAMFRLVFRCSEIAASPTHLQFCCGPLEILAPRDSIKEIIATPSVESGWYLEFQIGTTFLSVFNATETGRVDPELLIAVRPSVSHECQGQRRV